MSHRYKEANHAEAGLTFVGVIVSAALMLLIFGALFSAFTSMIDIVSRQKGEAGAVALINERIEYMRSLPYNSVGTQGGIVSGNLPQNSTTTLNGIVYAERVLVTYVDDEADGSDLGSGDSNGIPSDYKQVKIEYTWDHKGVPNVRSAVTNIVPNGIETTAGGGTLVVNVFDAVAQPVENAAVRVVNDTTTSTIDTTVFSNSDGRAVFSGAPAAANYQVSVSKTGFSTDQTYSATTSNPSPNPPHVAVVESGVSTISLSIDELSDLSIETRTNPVVSSSSDTFTNSSLLATTASTTVAGGALVLTGVPGGYDALGTAQATKTEPVSLHRWLSIESDIGVPSNTDASVQLYWVSTGGTYTLVSDTDLPGNSIGLPPGIIDISSLDTSTYPRLALGATLESFDGSSTPEIRDWGITYETSATAVGNVVLTIAGDKSIGTNASGSPIQKFSTTTTTDGGGLVTLSDIEWDYYSVAINGASEGYDIAEACSNVPYALNPDADDIIVLTLEPYVANTLRVMVQDVGGNPVPGADVRLQRSGFDDTETTSVCGQAFFNTGLSVNSDYVIDVTGSGFTPENVTGVSVDGTTNLIITVS